MGNNASQSSHDRRERILPHEVLDLITRHVVLGYSPEEAAEQDKHAHRLYRSTDHVKLVSDVEGLLYKEELTRIEQRHSWVISHHLLFPGLWPEGFFSHAWLSSSLELECTVFIDTMQALDYLAEILANHHCTGTYITALVMVAGEKWFLAADNCGETSEETVIQVLSQLPALKALVLRRTIADVALACGMDCWAELFPHLATLSLEALRYADIYLAELPRGISSLTLKRMNHVVCERPFNYPYLHRLDLGVNSWRRCPDISAFSKISALRSMRIEDFNHEDVRALLETLGPQLLDFHADLTKQNSDRLPPWLFHALPNLTAFVVTGTCNRGVLSSIPHTVRTFKWLATEHGHLKDMTEVMRCLSTPLLLPNLKAIPHIALKIASPPNSGNNSVSDLAELLESLFPKPPALHPSTARPLTEAQQEQTLQRQAQLSACAALLLATRTALKHLREERRIEESDPAALHYSYMSLWGVADVMIGDDVSEHEDKDVAGDASEDASDITSITSVIVSPNGDDDGDDWDAT